MNSQDHINKINYITGNFSTLLTAEQQKAAVAAVERARENIEWLSYHGDSISEWLIQNGFGAAGSIFMHTSFLLLVIISLAFSFVH